ncbi:MAG: hypothetical protein WBN35_08960 [Acidimicrobiia bacterium]|jgi:hypothetical protein
MRIAGIVGGIALAVIGAVWVLQGLNSEFAPESFMTGSPVWIVVGVLTLAGGIALARWSWKTR